MGSERLWGHGMDPSRAGVGGLGQPHWEAPREARPHHLHPLPTIPLFPSLVPLPSPEHGGTQVCPPPPGTPQDAPKSPPCPRGGGLT